jgi:16S rRNA (cytidine1402-2'-O)-methyltransferase
MNGSLYLIPSTIGETSVDRVIPAEVQQIVNSIKFYIVENERTARRQLIKMGIKTLIDDLTFFVLNEHTNKDIIHTFLTPCETENVGLLSEAGVPAVADPGSDIVAIAHDKGIRVVPMVGPSSILLSLMASGMNGQNFVFHGYLPVKPHDRIKRIKEIESASGKLRQAQIFIEAPYRNNQMLNDLITGCNPQTRLCIACNITQDDEFIKTLPIGTWKKQKPDLHKKPTIFVLQQ